MFEATIAQVEANSAVMGGARKPTKEVMLHHGRALDHLQQRLADQQRRLEDLTFHIIISIMGTHVSVAETFAPETQLIASSSSPNSTNIRLIWTVSGHWSTCAVA